MAITNYHVQQRSLITLFTIQFKRQQNREKNGNRNVNEQQNWCMAKLTNIIENIRKQTI